MPNQGRPLLTKILTTTHSLWSCERHTAGRIRRFPPKTTATIEFSIAALDFSIAALVFPIAFIRENQYNHTIIN